MKLFVSVANKKTSAHFDVARACVQRLESELGAKCVLSLEDSMLLFQDADRAGNTDGCSAIVAIGGDGSVLKAAQIAIKTGLPLVGINSGRLGYLCAFSASDVESITKEAFKSLYESPRTLLSFSCAKQQYTAVNEVTISKSNTGSTTDINIFCDGMKIGEWRCDGVMVSTPTGSTAYNLSAGGPVIMPEADCFVITPVCPHSLNARPVVISDNCTVSLEVVDFPGNEAVLSADGVFCSYVKHPVEIKKSPVKLRLLVGDRSSFTRLVR